MLGSTGCSWFNRDEPVPAYITIEPFEVITTSAQGTNSHAIADGWITVNGESLGPQELPATIPVLQSGELEVRVDPGIKNNGISGERKKYPFFDFFATSASFSEGQITSISPTTTYFSSCQFWIEDFEDAGVQLAAHSSSQVGINQVGSSNQFEGSNAGLIALGSSENFALIQSTANLILPKLGRRVYLELNYRCTHPFRVGVLHKYFTGEESFSYIATVSDTETDGVFIWKKIYIELTEKVSEDQFSINQEIYFEITKGSDVSNATLYIDNIKVIYLSN